MNSSTNNEMVPFVLPYKSNSGTNCTSMDPIFQLVHGKDFVSMMRAVFKAKLFFPIAEVYRYTRTYELGLSMADYLIETLNDCSQQTTTDERNNWMAHFLVLRLTMLDYLNQWQEYIICYDQVTKALETGQLDAHYSYLFLTNRYEIVQRKLDKKNHGYKLGNLLRHQQDQLTQEEIDYRFNRVIRLLKSAYLTQSGNLWL